MNDLLTKLGFIADRYAEVGKQIVDPSIISDQQRYISLMKEYKELEDIVEVYNEYKNVLENIESSKQLLEEETDAEMRQMAKDEIDSLLPRKQELDEVIKLLLIPKDPEDSKDVIIEIRAGAGGDEASIFAGDLFRMYTKYIEDSGWKMEIATVNEGTSGGFKEISFSV